MTAITLFYAPGSCSRVPMIALFEAGAAFTPELVRFMKGEHNAPAFARINPKGKIPALVIDGEALTENVAILVHLNHLFPAAKLLPEPANAMDTARQIADLCFCSATLHPLVSRIRMPARVATPEAARAVWEAACTAMRKHFALIEARMTDGAWWYGETWSVMDAYLNWVFWRVAGADFPVGDFPRFAGHAQRMEARPAYLQSTAIETAANEALEAEGLTFKPQTWGAASAHQRPPMAP